jgi:DNA-binding transcriptional ArsR family regulator
MTTPRRPSGKTDPKRAPRGRPSSRRDPGAAADESAPDSRPRRQLITDTRAMRALAHPLRVALLEMLRRDGEITATRAAELLDESPGNMSWHLQTLAKYGFVEEANEGRGRRRPWRLTSDSHRFETGMTDDPETVAAGEALERTFLARTHEQMRDWWSQRLTYPVKWRRAAFVVGTVRYVTPEELTSIMEEITAIYDRFADREAKDSRPPEAMPVNLYAHGHPLPPTPSGN